MNAKVVAGMVGIVLVVFLALFEVRLDFVFSRAREVMVADAGQEARFAACVEERDRQIHREAFGTIDNPDVQREVLKTEKEKAVAACREHYPEFLVPVSEPMQFRLFDVKLRYWH